MQSKSDDEIHSERPRVGDAKQIAREWVVNKGSETPGFAGAFFHGSVNWLPEDAPLAATSDLDIMLALQGEPLPRKPGKLLHNGLILEVSHISTADLESPYRVLAEYNLAGSFHRPSVILDPTGQLTRLQKAVGAQYARQRWVRARSRQALRKSAAGLAGIDASAPFHEQVTAWLFATGVMTHVLLTAGLKNPTVRTRYVAARSLLEEYGRADFYEALLSLLEHGKLTQERSLRHLDALSHAYDTAASVLRSPFPFASDISALARPVAIDGSQILIEQGLHREAVFWLVATYSRCMQVFCQDAPEQMRSHETGFRELLQDLGVLTSADLRQRADQALALFPRLWSVAEYIMDATPEINEGRSG